MMSCAKVVKNCNDYRNKYKVSSITLPAIASECHTISIALSQIHELFDRDPNRTISKLPEHLRPIFDNALAGCEIVISVIDDEIRKLNSSADGNTLINPSRVARIKHVWSED